MENKSEKNDTQTGVSKEESNITSAQTPIQTFLEFEATLIRETIPETIKKIEEQMKATYVGDFDTKDGRHPAVVFYQEEKHPEGSNYFGVYKDPSNGQFYIFDAIHVTTSEYPALIHKETNEVVYSASVHDFQELRDSSFIDGGRHYCRFGWKDESKDDFEIGYGTVVDGKLKFLRRHMI